MAKSRIGPASLGRFNAAADRETRTRIEPRAHHAPHTRTPDFGAGFRTQQEARVGFQPSPDQASYLRKVLRPSALKDKSEKPKLKADSGPESDYWRIRSQYYATTRLLLLEARVGIGRICAPSQALRSTLSPLLKRNRAYSPPLLGLTPLDTVLDTDSEHVLRAKPPLVFFTYGCGTGRTLFELGGHLGLVSQQACGSFRRAGLTNVHPARRCAGPRAGAYRAGGPWRARPRCPSTIGVRPPSRSHLRERNHQRGKSEPLGHRPGVASRPRSSV